MNRFAYGIVLRAVLLLACGAGVRNAVFRRKDEYMHTGGVWYYTIQSNLWVMFLTAVYLVLTLTGALMTTRMLAVARFAVLTGITLTFLVFWAVLAPKMEKAYLLSLNNFLVHTAVPLLYIADFFLFDRLYPLQNTDILCALALPLLYLGITFLHAAFNPKLQFEGGGRYPYFFLDADRFGWFGTQNGLGVFWWILILLCITLGIGFFYNYLLTLFV